MYLRSWRWIALLAFGAAAVFALRLIGPRVPNELDMLTGPEGTSFHDDGLRYQEILGRHGVTVHLLETTGSSESLEKLVEAEGIDDAVDFSENPSATPSEALESLHDSRVGAIIATGDPDSELIDSLSRSSELRALSIRRAEAFAVRHRFLEPVRFPEGAHDLRANIPDRDLQLLAARTQLVVSDPFPPALADLLLQAATEIHGGATAFSDRGEFPSPATSALPLNRAALNYYTNGPSKLQRFLPLHSVQLEWLELRQYLHDMRDRLVSM